MNPIAFPQKLCALRPYGPSFLGESSQSKNKSHSPHPPIRKRLYSEDFNTILMDNSTRQVEEEGVPVDPFVGKGTSHLNLGQSQIFSEEINISTQKGNFLRESRDFCNEMEPFTRDPMNFETRLHPLTEESPFEEDSAPSLPLDLSKTDFKRKNHFEEIFNSGKKDKEERLLGKREEFDNQKTLSMSPIVNDKRMQEALKMALKVQENSSYMFKSKRVNSTQNPLLAKDFSNKSKFEIPKLEEDKKRSQESHSKVQRRDSKVPLEKRGSNFNG